jgi:hypothetical protein
MFPSGNTELLSAALDVFDFSKQRELKGDFAKSGVYSRHTEAYMTYKSCMYLKTPSTRVVMTLIRMASFLMAQKAIVGQSLLITETSRSHSDTPHPVGFLWTSDQPDAETST